MEIFEKLIDPLKNIIRKQVISCDELTGYGSKCGKKFIYSVSDFLGNKDELKKVMVNCTKFCLKHLSNLAIHGELLICYENKTRKIERISKNIISIIGTKNKITRIKLDFVFGGSFFSKNQIIYGNLKSINYLFDEETIDDLKEFNKIMVKNEFGFVPILHKHENKYGNMYEAKFKYKVNLINREWKSISKLWRKFIKDCFKYENLDKISYEIKGTGNTDEIYLSKNSILVLGNLDSIEISSKKIEMKSDYNIVTNVVGTSIILNNEEEEMLKLKKQKETLIYFFKKFDDSQTREEAILILDEMFDFLNENRRLLKIMKNVTKNKLIELHKNDDFSEIAEKHYYKLFGENFN